MDLALTPHNIWWQHWIMFLWRKYFCISLVAFGFGIPMIFGINTWPWSNYPMFATSTSVENIRILQVYLKQTDGSEERVWVQPGRPSDRMLQKGLDAHDGTVLLSIVKSLVIGRSPEELDSAAALLIYEARPKGNHIEDGVALALLETVPLHGR